MHLNIGHSHGGKLIKDDIESKRDSIYKICDKTLKIRDKQLNAMFSIKW